MMKIQECRECGMLATDYKDIAINGLIDTCTWCGAMDNSFEVECTCGNDLLWDEHSELAPECPECGAHSNDYVIKQVDSAFIINNILKRPDLHKERVWVSVSFVETLMKFVEHTE